MHFGSVIDFIFRLYSMFGYVCLHFAGPAGDSSPIGSLTTLSGPESFFWNLFVRLVQALVVLKSLTGLVIYIFSSWFHHVFPILKISTIQDPPSIKQMYIKPAPSKLWNDQFPIIRVFFPVDPPVILQTRTPLKTLMLEWRLKRRFFRSENWKWLNLWIGANMVKLVFTEYRKHLAKKKTHLVKYKKYFQYWHVLTTWKKLGVAGAACVGRADFSCHDALGRFQRATACASAFGPGGRCRAVPAKNEPHPNSKPNQYVFDSS